MNYHSAAELFPLIVGEDFDRLVADIDTNGQREAIVVLPTGEILDGRNRYRACDRLRIKPITRVYAGDAPLAYVISLNLHRRHLNESQRAMAASKLANMQQGERTDLEPSANLQKVSQGKAAEMLHVSARTVAAAAKVRAEGAPELVHAVEQGRVAVSQAAKIADMEPDKQREMVVKIEKGEKAHVSNNSGENEWYTPAVFIAAARAVMGAIDLDPASCLLANKTVRAEQYFDIKSNGLNHQWFGRIWMNPPYAQPLIQQFCQKIIEEFYAKRVKQACVLVNNATETMWGQALLMASTAVCFPHTRIKFTDKEGSPSGAPLQGQMIAYLGRHPNAFYMAFAEFGVIRHE